MVTHVIQSSTVLCCFDNLYSRIIAYFDTCIDGKRDLRETKGAWIRVVRGPYDLEDGDHGIRHVKRNCAVAHIDVEQGIEMAWEPSWLDCDSATLDRP